MDDADGAVDVLLDVPRKGQDAGRRSGIHVGQQPRSAVGFTPMVVFVIRVGICVRALDQTIPYRRVHFHFMASYF